MAGRVNVAGPFPAHQRPQEADGGAPVLVWACYAVLVAVLLGYFVWLVVSPNDTFSVPIDGWLVDGIDVSGGVLCLVRAFSRRGQDRVHGNRPGRLAVRLGLRGHCTYGPVPGRGDAPRSAVGTRRVLPFVLPARLRGTWSCSSAKRCEGSAWLAGSTASWRRSGLRRSARMFAFHRILLTAGGSAASVATSLAYPLGDLLLLTLIVGGTHLLPRHRRAPWAMLATGMALNVVGDTFNLFGSTSFGMSRFANVTNSIAWPSAILVISMAVWVRPRKNAVVVQRQIGSLLPALAATAALGILIAGTVRHPGPVAVGLATATLVVAGVRVGLTMWELRKLTEQRRMESITDSLTGLGNRRHLFQVLDQFFEEQRSSALEDKRQLAFLFMDLNHFKEINDSFGHPAGDLLLEHLGARFMASLRVIDTPVRLGGDEFAVVLMDADATEAASVAQRLMDCLEEPFELGSLSASVSASIGVALAPNDATESAGSLLVRGRGDVPRQGGRKGRCVLRPCSRRRRPVEPGRGSPPGARRGSAGPALPAPTEPPERSDRRGRSPRALVAPQARPGPAAQVHPFGRGGWLDGPPHGVGDR